MSPITIELVIILLLTIINGLFAMSEVALLSARKVRLQHLAERGNSQAAAALLLLKDPAISSQRSKSESPWWVWSRLRCLGVVVIERLLRMLSKQKLSLHLEQRTLN